MSATHASMLTTRKKDRRVTMVVTMVIRYAERTSLQLRLHGVPLVRTDPTRHSTLLSRLDESGLRGRKVLAAAVVRLHEDESSLHMRNRQRPFCCKPANEGSLPLGVRLETTAASHHRSASQVSEKRALTHGIRCHEAGAIEFDVTPIQP